MNNSMTIINNLSNNTLGKLSTVFIEQLEENELNLLKQAFSNISDEAISGYIRVIFENTNFSTLNKSDRAYKYKNTYSLFSFLRENYSHIFINLMS